MPTWKSRAENQNVLISSCMFLSWLATYWQDSCWFPGFKCLYLTHPLHPVTPQPSMFQWCIRVRKLNYEESLFHSSKLSACFMVHQPSVISINVSCVGNSSVLERYFPIPRHLTFPLRTQDPRDVFIWNNWGAPRTLNTFKTY